jgi:TonB family protein
MLMMVVSEKGEVVDPTIVISAHPDLDRRVVTAVRKWKYQPARKNGKPVKSFVTVTVTLELGRA